MHGDATDIPLSHMTLSLVYSDATDHTTLSLVYNDATDLLLSHIPGKIVCKYLHVTCKTCKILQESYLTKNTEEFLAPFLHVQDHTFLFMYYLARVLQEFSDNYMHNMMVY